MRFYTIPSISAIVYWHFSLLRLIHALLSGRASLDVLAYTHGDLELAGSCSSAPIWSGCVDSSGMGFCDSDSEGDGFRSATLLYFLRRHDGWCEVVEFLLRHVFFLALARWLCPGCRGIGIC